VTTLATSATPRVQRVGSTPARARTAVWVFRALLVIPFALMAPEVVSAVQGRPGSVANVSASTADVLGTSAFLIFVLMMTVTPVHTVTGWRWHVILRRDYGIAMFAVAATDLILAATTTGDTFPGGPLTRIGGHSFLVVGTLTVALLVPLALTANRRSQRRLGGHWKTIQRLTYVVWALVLLHLFLLFDLNPTFLEAVAMSVPLLILRVPTVRRRWTAARREKRRRVARAVAAIVLTAIFAAGFAPFVNELAVKGSAAFIQSPVRD
jgi:sulfoxide reductase heme-binding subunit YedZ